MKESEEKDSRSTTGLVIVLLVGALSVLSCLGIGGALFFTVGV